MSKSARLKKLQQVFNEFDLDGTGEIESTELLQLGQARRALGQKGGEWTEEKNARLVRKIDVNADGTVRGAEFCEFFEKSLTSDEMEFEDTVKQFMTVASSCRTKKMRQPNRQSNTKQFNNSSNATTKPSARGSPQSGDKGSLDDRLEKFLSLEATAAAAPKRNSRYAHSSQLTAHLTRANHVVAADFLTVAGWSKD